jgi:hypothetical protein
MNKRKQQVKKQKQDGQIQTTNVVKGEPLPSPLAVLLAVRQTLQNFMLTVKAVVQTKLVKSAIKKPATNVGTQDPSLIVGHLEITNTALPKNTWLRYMKNKMVNAQFVVKYQKLKEDCMLTIAIQPGSFVGFYATGAIQELVR